MMKKSDRGYTMIIVMCLMFLFMALAFSVLFSSAQTLARAQREAARKQSRASAVSFAEWIDEELKALPDEAQKKLSYQIRERLLNETNKWPSYTGELEGEVEVAVLTFTPKMGTGAASAFKEEEFGQLEVKMYWEAEDGSRDPKAPGVNLVVTVKATVRGEQFSVTTRYAKSLDAANDWDGTWHIRGRE